MPIAFAPTSNALPPVRSTTARPNNFYSAFPSYAPCSWVLTNRNRVWLRNGGKPLRFGTVIKCGGGGGGAGTVREIDESQFPDVVLKSERPVLVEFVATWCGPCRLIAPAVQSLAEDFEKESSNVEGKEDKTRDVYGLKLVWLFK